MANSLVTANLMGHDSHGIIRVQEYCEEIEAGTLVATAQPEVITETATTATVSGNWGFGHVTARAGAEVAITKAKEANVSVVGLVQQNHIGRLGEWSAMMAEAGMIGMVVTGGWRPPAVSAAPFGGAARQLSTNPYSFAIPTGKHDIVLVDFATTVIAEGKVRLARAKGVPLPAGAILDKNDTSYNFLPLSWTYGAAMQNEQGALTFKSPAMVEAIKTVKRMWDAKLIPPGVVTWDSSGNNTAYQKGQAVFAYNPNSIYAALEAPAKAAAATQIDKDSLPTLAVRPACRSQGQLRRD